MKTNILPFILLLLVFSTDVFACCEIEHSKLINMLDAEFHKEGLIGYNIDLHREPKKTYTLVMAKGCFYQIPFYDRYFKVDNKENLKATLFTAKRIEITSVDLGEMKTSEGKINYLCQTTGIYYLEFESGQYTCGGATIGFIRPDSSTHEKRSISISIPNDYYANTKKPRSQSLAWSFEQSEDLYGYITLQILFRDETWEQQFHVREKSDQELEEEISKSLLENYGIDFIVKVDF